MGDEESKECPSIPLRCEIETKVDQILRAIEEEEKSLKKEDTM